MMYLDANRRENETVDNFDRDNVTQKRRRTDTTDDNTKRNATVAMREIYRYEAVPVRLNTLELHLYPKISWIREWDSEASKIYQTYEEFVKSKIINKSAKQVMKYHVMYFNEQEREQYRAVIEDDKILRCLGKQFENGRYIFLLMPCNSLFISRKFNSHWGRIHHSSFSRGEPVKSAGWLTFDEKGDLSEISNFTGHYPCSYTQVLNLLLYLKPIYKGLDRVKLVFSENGKADEYTTTTVADWIAANGFIHEWNEQPAASEKELH